MHAHEKPGFPLDFNVQNEIQSLITDYNIESIILIWELVYN